MTKEEQEIYDKGHKDGWNAALSTVIGKVKRDTVNIPITHTHTCPSCSTAWTHKRADCPQIQAMMRVCKECQNKQSNTIAITGASKSE